MKINILTDSEKSWFIPYGLELKEKLKKHGNDVLYINDSKNVPEGDILFLLSCTQIISRETLKLNKNNIVVHASDLPKGKGFSPLQWQILEGKKEITLTLFEVVEKVDAGPYYLKHKLNFNGTELLDEMRKIMAEKIIYMCLQYVLERNTLQPIQQEGEESFYPRRKEKDDELDVEDTIKNQFNLLRIADNEKHPLYFNLNGCKYKIKIYKA